MKPARLIILAAGRGTRLGEAAAGRPKCMAALHSQPLISWQIAAARANGFEKITIVRGYQAEQIDFAGVDYAYNPVFDRTNMVYTLAAAREWWGDGFVLSYGDIVYEPGVLRAVKDHLAAGTSGTGVVVDRAWLSYWQMRSDDPLDDAETLRLDGDRIVEIGQKPDSLDQIQAQYIGVTAFSSGGVAALGDLLDREARAHAAGKRLICPDRAYPDLYVTDVLQALIRDGHAVEAIPIDAGWFEIDTPADLEIAQSLSSVTNDVPPLLEIHR